MFDQLILFSNNIILIVLVEKRRLVTIIMIPFLLLTKEGHIDISKFWSASQSLFICLHNTKQQRYPPPPTTSTKNHKLSLMKKD